MFCWLCCLQNDAKCCREISGSKKKHDVPLILGIPLNREDDRVILPCNTGNDKCNGVLVLGED